MRPRHAIALLLLGVVSSLFALSPVHAARNLKLKPGARGKVCVECHDAFQQILKKRFVHTPLSKGECTGCHNPHTSDHGLLLATERGEICYECHDEMLLPEARSSHEVFVEGKCSSCHDPHAADNKNILLKAGSQLCFECHQELGERIGTNKFEHSPVKEDCLDCHDPHNSARHLKLLRNDVPTLCLDCHEPDKASFKRAHEYYPVEKARCTSCHDAHGSNVAAILFDNVHDPVDEKKCGECHVGANSSPAFALKDVGYQICEGCHYDTVVDAFNLPKLHWPLVDSTGCVNCHAPHASGRSDLIRGSMLVVCGNCHADTVRRQQRSQTKHPPIADGECSECHLPHGSENLFLLDNPSYLEVCGDCHEWQAHSTHPIGQDVVDTRNDNLRLDCFSCHRSHGTEYRHFLYFESTDEMCVQCHIKYRR